MILDLHLKPGEKQGCLYIDRREEGKVSVDEARSEVRRWLKRAVLYLLVSLFSPKQHSMCLVHLLKKEETEVSGIKVGELKKVITSWEKWESFFQETRRSELEGLFNNYFPTGAIPHNTAKITWPENSMNIDASFYPLSCLFLESNSSCLTLYSYQ